MCSLDLALQIWMFVLFNYKLQLKFYPFLLSSLAIFCCHNATITPTCLQVQYFFSTKNNVVSCPPFILACHVASSCCGALPSSLPLFSSCNSYLSNLHHIEVVLMSLNRSSYTCEESLPILPKVGIKKQNYDTTRKFQNKWVTKFPWAKCL
jgi:hypothetical protein